VKSISKRLQDCIRALVFGYVFLALGVSGVPYWSGMAAVAAALLFISLFLIRAFDSELVPIDRWLVLPVIFLFASGVLSIYSHIQGADVTGNFLSLTVAWVGASSVAVAIRTTACVRSVLYAMALASVVNAIAILMDVNVYVYLDSSVSFSAELFAQSRATGLIGNPNILSFNAIILVFCLAAWDRQASPWIWVVSLSCAALAVYQTGSRKAVILALVFLALLATRVWRHRNRNPITFLMLVGIFASGGVLIAQNYSLFVADFSALQRTLRDFDGDGESLSLRLELLTASWALILESPIWGHGFDMARRLSGLGLYMHNNALELLVNGGLILFTVYYAMYLRIFRYLVRIKSNESFDRAAMLFLIFAVLIADLATVTYTTKSVSIAILTSMSILSAQFSGASSKNV
jgi:O-antigen ligase